jgi:hypothetical protein
MNPYFDDRPWASATYRAEVEREWARLTRPPAEYGVRARWRFLMRAWSRTPTNGRHQR